MFCLQSKFGQTHGRSFLMRVVKAAVLGLSIIGFTAGTAAACGWSKSAETKKPTVKQTVVTNTTKTTKQ